MSRPKPDFLGVLIMNEIIRFDGITIASPVRADEFETFVKGTLRQRMIQDAQLGKHGGLSPIEMLVGYFTGVKLNDAHEGCPSGKSVAPLSRR
jgi:hypothetical protein